MAPNPSRDPVLDCRGHMPDTGGHALVRLQRRRPEVRLQVGRLGFAGSFDGVRRVTGDPKLKATTGTRSQPSDRCSVESPWTTPRRRSI